MNILIAKLGATGDVVRTSSLLRRLPDSVTWITAAKNISLLQNSDCNVRCLSWDDRAHTAASAYDLVINLEDTLDVAQFVRSLKSSQIFGAYADSHDRLSYTDDSRSWFDLSLISRFGRKRADEMKYENRTTYQEHIFSGLGFDFADETYVLPAPPQTGLSGDVALAAESGPVWPMKQWAYYPELKQRLEADGLTVNVLPKRQTLTEHLGDVAGHRCLVGGDSLPMHLALGLGVRTVTIFNCTSPWEIHGYGIQTKLISPLIGDYFYKRDFDPRATTAISLNEVLAATHEQLRASAPSLAR